MKDFRLDPIWQWTVALNRLSYEILDFIIAMSEFDHFETCPVRLFARRLRFGISSKDNIIFFGN